MKSGILTNKGGSDASSRQGGRSALAAFDCRRRGVATTLSATGRRRHESAFTLAEVLAALLFLAIVIPAAVEALHVASLSGEVAVRKGVAARLADRVLNESLVMTNWNTGTHNGTVTEGAQEFRWTLTSQNWPVDALQLLTVEVKYAAQGRDFSVKLSTLANPLTLTMTGSQQ
jgi:hypothetical protein